MTLQMMTGLSWAMIGAKNVTSFCVSASAGSGQLSHTHERG
jgi:hypothetical protein